LLKANIALHNGAVLLFDSAFRSGRFRRVLPKYR